MSTSDESRERAATREIVQSIVIGDQPVKSGLEEFLEANTVLGDEREADLLTSIYKIDKRLTAPATWASRADAPKSFSKEYSILRKGLNAAIQLVTELDKYRYGELAGHHGTERHTGPLDLKALSNLEESDKWLATMITHRIDNIKVLAEHCDCQQIMLSRMNRLELHPTVDGKLIGISKLGWEEEFTALYFKLRSWASKLDIQIENRNKRRRDVHEHLAKAYATLERDKSISKNGVDTAVEAARAGDNVVSLFAVARHVTKVRAG